MSALSRADLSALASAIYGPRWQTPLAREMDVALRTVQRWARDGVERPATADSVRRFLAERARPDVAPPAGPDDQRDDEAYALFRPRIEAMLHAAHISGWHPAEVMTAILSIAVDLMREGAGTAATIETMKAALASLKSQRDT